ncbi:MAG TPA: serine/threonine-protein kinase [Acidobacteriota bacterium]
MIGQKISHYRVLDKLGQGGTGIVYRAEDTVLGRNVALKLLNPEATRNENLRLRLKQEARAAAGLSHPGIATVYGLEQAGDDLFIVYEYVKGETLQVLMDKGPLGLDRVLQIAADIGGALAAAHGLGIVHRDLKPENIICCADGGIKVLDFGLARFQSGLWDSEPPATRITAEGTIVGTVAYMSPEQIEGREVDFRSDVFSFGILLYELASGVHPFEGATPASTTVRILTLQPVAPSQINPLTPPELDAIVRKCLSKNPEQRYQSTPELVAEIDRLRRREGSSENRRSGAGRTLVGVSPVGDALSPRWWWQFHQLSVTIVYCVLLFPVWRIKEWIPPSSGATIFFAVLVCSAVASILRLHLWFTSVVNSGELRGQLQRLARLVRWVDWCLAALLLTGAAAVASGHVAWSGLLTALAIGIFLTSLIVEPATTAAAFGRPGMD